MEIKITEHSLFRYAQRIKNQIILNLNDYKFFAKNNIDLVVEYEIELLEIFKKSEFIYQGSFSRNDKNKIVKFYLNKKLGIIIATSTNDDSLITIYRIDYGFGYNVNRSTMLALYKELKRIDDKRQSYIEKNSSDIEQIEIGLDSVDLDIEVYENRIKTLKLKKENLQNEIKMYKSEIEQYKLDHDEKCRQICYSIAYKS